MKATRKAICIAFAMTAVITASSAVSSATDKAEMEAVVREYIRNHPEEIAGAMQKHQAAQQAQQEEAALKQALANRVQVQTGDAPSLGPDKAPITIVEFSDFQCPYCARAVGPIGEVMRKNKDKIRLVFINSPLPMHPKAPDAARAAMAARLQLKFWEYREKLLGKQNEWSSAADPKKSFIQYAKELNMDTARFEKDMARPENKKRLDDDMALAAKLGVNGTPTYFVNGVQVVGAREASYFDRVIAAVSNGGNSK